MPRLRVRRLSSQIFASQLAILTATVLMGFVLFAYEERGQLDRQYEQRSIAIAQAVADMPDVQNCIEYAGPGCAALVQARATKLQADTNAAYVVVIDMNRVRHSHPKPPPGQPSLIGQKVEEPIVTIDGQTHAGIDNGATGRSANGKAPMYGTDGAMIGEVSVGIKESRVSVALWDELPAYAGWFAVALGVGAVASWLLARRLKRKTFGLELDEIAQLLQEREATLHGIREGVVAFDQSGRVTMVNDEARRLLKIGTAPVGGQLDDLVPPGRLRDVLAGRLGGADDVVLTDDYALVVNRMPVILAGRPHGAVVTLRDRTEMSGLLRELDGVRSLTDSLRAQQHEFTNRMHTLAGLIELGQYDDALGYLTEMRGSATEFADSVRSRIAAPLIVGLLLGKAAVASERGIALEITDDTWLDDAVTRPQALTTIVGNLIDNAFEALATTPGTGHVTLAIVEDDDSITVRVADNGPGIPEGTAEAIFVDGYTTKQARGSLHRGLGLALVHRLALRLNGTITVSEGPGAEFTVQLPKSTLTAPLPDSARAAERAVR
jgi:two-component system CitB family sensor kinase